MSIYNNNYTPNIPTFGEFTSKFGPKIIERTRANINTIMEKWNKIIIDYGSIKFLLTDEFYIYLELYLEYLEYIRNLGITQKGTELKDFFNNILYNISSKKYRRSRVKNKVYNYDTGSLEYELEDGTYIKIPECEIIEEKISMNDIYTEEYIKIIDISKYREIRIKDIIENG